MNDITVIYYTSNREDQEFEERIARKLLEACEGVPLISVSQQPMPWLGDNICIGDVGCSYLNEYRQIAIGCKMAKTKYIVAAEADCLYPPSYFIQPPPPNDQCLALWDNLWILKRWRRDFQKKDWSPCALITNREYYLKRIEKSLSKLPQDSESKVAFSVFKKTTRVFVRGEEPVINVKTLNGIQKNTRVIIDLKPVMVLPYWGQAKKLKKELGL